MFVADKLFFLCDFASLILTSNFSHNYPLELPPHPRSGEIGGLHLNPKLRERLIGQIAKDSKFLAQHELMDYRCTAPKGDDTG